MKELTYEAVKRAAMLLIETNDQTTTLEIKLMLRDLGYEAKQHEVSDIMSEFGDEGYFSYQDNGKHRIYEEPSYSILDDEDKEIDDDENTDEEELDDFICLESDASEYTKKQLKNDFDDTDMVVWDADGIAPVCVYDGSYERNDMKTHYSKKHGVGYMDVRLCTVKFFAKHHIND